MLQLLPIRLFLRTEPLFTVWAIGNGGVWSEYSLGMLEIDGSNVAVTATQTDIVRGCTGDPSCFDDDENLMRTPYEYHVSCVGAEGRYRCEREER